MIAGLIAVCFAGVSVGWWLGGVEAYTGHTFRENDLAKPPTSVAGAADVAFIVGALGVVAIFWCVFRARQSQLTTALLLGMFALAYASLFLGKTVGSTKAPFGREGHDEPSIHREYGPGVPRDKMITVG